jgi:myo-inositol-1(or 4)-monophosphatase
MRPLTELQELSAVVEAVLAGGEVLRRRFGGRLAVSYKGELDLVTEADTESERVIVDLLRRRAPGAAILGEEGGERGGRSSSRYIVDPLDGTTNFAHRYPFFAVSVALEREKEVVAAAVYDPLRQELFTAEKGSGAFLNGERLRVSASRELARALLITGFPYDLRVDLTGSLRLFNRFMGEARAIRRDGAAALDLCYVAAGRADGFWEERLKPWDTAAGALLVAEAGGRVTDFAGGPFDGSGREILASNGLIHESMLRVLAEPR